MIDEVSILRLKLQDRDRMIGQAEAIVQTLSALVPPDSAISANAVNQASLWLARVENEYNPKADD